MPPSQLTGVGNCPLRQFLTPVITTKGTHPPDPPPTGRGNCPLGKFLRPVGQADSPTSRQAAEPTVRQSDKPAGRRAGRPPSRRAGARSPEPDPLAADLAH